MKRALLFLLVTLCLTGGCSTDTLVGSYLFHKRHNIKNNLANQTYQQALTHHFREQTLLGTWTRANADHSENRPDLILSDTRWDLSLFDDGTYSVRREGRQVGSDFFGDSANSMIAVPMYTVAVQEGRWTRVSPGEIELRPDDPDQPAEPTTLDLNEWTNTFVEADRRLREDSQ